MNEDRPDSASTNWMREGRGIAPRVKWTCSADGPLTALDLAAETGEVFAADESGSLFRLDRTGRIAALTRFHDPVRILDWSDDGRFGVAVVGEATLHRLDREFQSVWKLDLPEVCVSAAISPFGTHIAAGLASAKNFICSEHKRIEGDFESVRPLAYLKWASAEPLLVGAGQHDLLAAYTVSGEVIWQEKLWSNIGDIALTGESDLIYLAAYHHGVQTFDGEGTNIGTYAVDGTVSKVAASFEPHRVIAATLERTLYWLDADGQLLWTTTAPEELTALHCDPLGEWIVCGFDSGRLIRLDWGG
jgi:hypothetical protein